MVFLGRDLELDVLRTVISAAEAGAGGAALIEGEAGLGKTRLLEQLTGEVTGSTIVWGRAWEESGAPPYWPWRQALQSLSRPIEWDDAAPSTSVATTVLEALRRASTERPLVVVLDDLHAADEDSRRLTAFIARSIGRLPITLLVASRPSADLSSISRASVPIRLQPLATAAADELITATSTVEVDAAQRDSINAVAEGNPLVTIELARLAGRAAKLPREIHAIVHDRLEPLHGEQRAILDAAAVLGRTFSIGRLARMSGATPIDMLAILEPAATLDVVVPIDNDAWRFSHQIIRDGIYEELPAVRRIELHAAAAQAIEAEDDPLAIGELARHLAEAVPLVDRATALTATLAAAEHAQLAGAHGDAAETYARALGLVDGDGERLDVLLLLGQAALDAGQVTRAWATFDEAIALSRTVDAAEGFARAALGRTERLRSDAFTLGWVPTVEAARNRLGPAPSALASRLLARRALIAAEAGQPDAHELAERAVAEAREVGDDPTLAECLAVLHLTCLVPELIERSAEVSDELVTVAERTGDLDRALEGTIAQLTTQLTLGNLAAADDALARCEALAATSGHPRHQFFALSRRGMRSFLAGRLSEGEELLERARELGFRIEEPDAEAVYHGAQMVVSRDLLDPDELLDVLRGLTSESEDPILLLYSATVTAGLGALDDARSLLDRVLGLYSLDDVIGQIGWPFWACQVVDVIVALEDRSLAVPLYDALAPHGDLLVINAGAVCFGGAIDHFVGLLAGLLGRPDEALARLTHARDLYRSIGAMHFLARIERELELLEATSGADGGPARDSSMAIERTPEGWRLVLGETVLVVPDSRGLQHIARLRATPGQDIHVLDLVSGVAGASALEPVATDLVLDDAAKAAYRERVADLQDDIAEADAHHDVERSALLRAELDALLDQLRQAAGLGGRTRAMPSDAERARVAVRKAIVNAIDRVTELQPTLGQHLREHVHTGLFCRYEPSST